MRKKSPARRAAGNRKGEARRMGKEDPGNARGPGASDAASAKNTSVGRDRVGLGGDAGSDNGKASASAHHTSHGNGTARGRRRKNGQGSDPDSLALSKNDIIDFCDRVIKKWQQDPAKNARNIPAMFAVRTSVYFSDESSLQAIWSEIISWVYQLLYENAQAQARMEGREWAHVFARMKGGQI